MLRQRPPLKRPKIAMTPMIDVVFLLLAFFVLTFKIIIPEGDFNIRMSSPGQAPPVEMDADSVHIRLRADEQGLISAILLNGEEVEHFDSLRHRVSALCRAKPDLEAVVQPDEHLHYEYVIQAITAVNGELRDGQIVTICDNIKFARENPPLNRSQESGDRSQEHEFNPTRLE